MNDQTIVYEWLFREHNCKESFLDHLASHDDTGYWQRAQNFIRYNSSTRVSFLSPEEYRFLENIRDDLIRESF